MRRYIILFMLVGGCFITFAQTQKSINVAEVIEKEASLIKQFDWKGDAYLFKSDSIYRLPFRLLRQRTETPLRGEIMAKGDTFVIKGSNLFPAVLCFAKGVVISANEEGIVVDHGNGLESCYGNLISSRVKVGGSVKKGQLLGKLPQEKELLFELRLHGSAIDVTKIFDPQTGLATYAGDLYLYNINDSIFVTRETPMVWFFKNEEVLNNEFDDFYEKGVSEHRAKRDFVDDIIKGAEEDEIKLEEIQIGPAQKQDTIRVKNIIIL